MQKIIRALTGAAAIYNEPLNSDRMDGYLMVLGKYPEDDIVAAIRESLDVCSYFPKPAEIIEIVKSISTNRRMIGGIEDIPELDCHERDEVTELLEEFRQKMKWGD